ncbi:MAG: hypothetical protein PHV34_15990 [Verrucomicrobiae bacterium]|nr:hypothetical protein [Verrucomicrobiae bacterium]
MKTTSHLKHILGAALLAVPLALIAADQPNPAKDKAPHGGRLMGGTAVRAEFLVKADQTVEVYLYDQQLKPVAPADQTVTLILQGKDGAKTKVEFNKGAGAFVSKSPVTIPEGAKAILAVKAGGKPENFRFDLIMSPCKGCKKPEYACDCEGC